MQRETIVLCDSNILIDQALDCEPWSSHITAFMERAVANDVTIAATSLSIKDLSYAVHCVMKRRWLHSESVVESATAKKVIPGVLRHVLRSAIGLYKIVPIGEPECRRAMALESRHSDFEDDLIIAAGESIGAVRIATYDEQLIKHFPDLCAKPEDIALPKD